MDPMLIIGIALTAGALLLWRSDEKQRREPTPGRPMWPFDARVGESREQMIARWEAGDR
jgi:hypothetical protein